MKVLLITLFFSIQVIAQDWSHDFGNLISTKVIPGQVKTEIVMKDIPAIRDQDGLGTCASFSTTTLLDSHCMKYSNCTKEPDAHISVLNVMSETSGGTSILEKVNGADVVQTLKKMQERMKDVPSYTLASEKCAPYETIEDEEYDYWSHWYGAGSKKLDTLKELYRRIMNKYEDPMYCTEDYYKRVFGSEVTNEELVKLYSGVYGYAIKQFLETILIPAKCRIKDRKKIPSFEVHHLPKDDKLPSTLSNETIRNEINKQLDNNNMLSIGMCTRIRSCSIDVNSMNDCPEEHRERNCGGHALNIVGSREVCPKDGFCFWQYKVHNSWGQDFQQKYQDGWVDEEKLLTGFKEAPNFKLTWLEKAKKREYRIDNEQGSNSWVCKKAGKTAFIGIVKSKREHELDGYTCSPTDLAL